MDEIEVLKRKYEREKIAREALEKILEDKNRELFDTNKRMEVEKHRAEMYLEVAKVMIVVIDLNQKVTLVNQKGCDILGYKKEEIISKNWFDNFVPEGKKAKGKEVFDKLIAGDIGSVEHSENAVLNKNCEERIISWHNSVLKDENGKINAVLRSGEDITEQRKYEKELEDNRTLLRTMIDNLPDYIFFKDIGSRFILNNEAHLCLLSAKEQNEVFGKSDFDIFSQELAAQYYEDEQRVIQSGQPLINREEYTITPEGKKQWLLTSKIPVINSSGKIIGLVGISRDITELKRTESELQQSLILLQNVIDSSIDFIFVKDHELRTILCNMAYAQAIGKSPSELNGKTDIENGWDPELVKGNPMKGIKGFENDDRKALSGEAVHNDYDPANVNGELRIFDTIKLPFRDKDNHIIGIFGISRDITERKQAADKLVESEEKFRLLFENAGDGILLADVESRNFVNVNKKMSELIGYSLNELLCLNVKDIHPMDDLPWILKEFEKLAKNEIDVSHDIPVLKKDGGVFYADINSKMIVFNGKAYIIGIFRDITKRKRVEELLKENEKKYRALFENSSDAIMIIGEKGFIDCNNATLKIFNLSSKEEFIGVHPAELSPPQQPDGEDSLTAANGKILEAFKNEKYQFDWVHRRKNGKDFSAEVLLTAFTLNNRQVLQATVRDISEKKILEEERKLRSNLAAIQNMIVTINHEMNQPLTVIIGSSDFLMKEVQKDSEIYEDVKIINAEAWRLAKLVKKTNEIKTLKIKEYTPGTKMIDLDDEKGEIKDV